MLRFATIRLGDRERVAVIDGDHVRVVPDCDSMVGLLDLLPVQRQALFDRAEDTLPLESVVLRPPVPRPPRNLFCVGLNYHDHIDEGESAERRIAPQFPVVFSKPWTCLTGHGEPVTISTVRSQQVDWEGEVAVVLGCTHDGSIAPVGLCLANDITARDLQKRHGQFLLGKGIDGFCPLGPYLTPIDEVDLSEVTFEVTVNGVAKQSGCLVDLIHPIHTLVQAIGENISLLAGDVILTGTPSGVGAWREPPEFLRPGDVVTITSPLLGTLTNEMI